MNPFLALIIANVIWGVGTPFFKLALQTIPPFTLAFFRFAGALLLLLPFYIKNYRPITKKQLMECFFVSFFGITINISFFFLGLQKAPSINASIIASSGPVLLYFLSILFLKEKFRPRIFSGMILGLAGVLLIILAPLWAKGGMKDIGALEGNIFFLIATVGAVLNPILQKGTLKELDPVILAFWMFVFGALSFSPFAATEMQHWSFSQMSPFSIFATFFGILFSSGIAYFLFIYGVRKTPGEEIGLFTYFDPVAAIIVAFLLLGEIPDRSFIAGAVLVFVGVFIAEGRLPYHPFHKLR